jgi:hypothetical protein
MSDEQKVKTTMVVTLKSGTQIRIGVTDFTTHADPVNGNLRSIDWTLDDDPAGSSPAWISLEEIAAVHAERALI